MLAVLIHHSTDVIQIWIEGGGAVSVASGLFYSGRALGRLNQFMRDIEQRVTRLERAHDVR